ncbi:MAG TPA: hypothetical protein VK752_30035 [Bryobacteraceae bacterium]|nr:hypothetical protein [Bryobacteraceae bacterium]
MEAKLRDEVGAERRFILDGMLTGVESAMDSSFTKQASDWDKYYILLGLAGSAVAVLGAAVAAIPAAAAGATVVTVEVAGGLGMLRVAAVGGILSVGGGTLNGYAGYEQNVKKPDFSPTQDVIAEMKKAIKTAIQQEIYLNTRDPPYLKLVADLMQKHGSDKKWVHAFTSDASDAAKLRGDLLRMEFYGKVEGFFPNVAAANGAQEACESLFPIIASVYPPFKSSMADVNEWVGTVEDDAMGLPRWKLVPPDDNLRNRRAKAKHDFVVQYPNFASYLRAQQKYISWKNGHENGLPMKMSIPQPG